MPAMVRDFLRRGLVSAGRAGPGGAEVELRPAAAVDEAASGIRWGGSWTEKSGDDVGESGSSEICVANVGEMMSWGGGGGSTSRRKHTHEDVSLFRFLWDSSCWRGTCT